MKSMSKVKASNVFLLTAAAHREQEGRLHHCTLQYLKDFLETPTK